MRITTSQRSSAAVAFAPICLLLLACDALDDPLVRAFDEKAEAMCGTGYRADPPATFHGYLTIGEEIRRFYPHRGDLGESIRSNPYPSDFAVLDGPTLADTPAEQAFVQRRKTLDNAAYEARFKGRRVTGQHSCARYGKADAVIIDTLLEIKEVHF